MTEPLADFVGDVPAGQPGTRPRGRDAELARIGLLLDAARSGRSGALAIVGEPGIGKTALLDAAVAMARGMLVMRARGVEAEAELPFAGLHELLASSMPAPSRPSALSEALRGRPLVGSDRFAIYVDTLEVLAATAEERPVLVLIDDLQWLDAASSETLRFVARRLDREGIALLLASRAPPVRVGQDGIEWLALSGLGEAAAAALIEERRGQRPGPEVITALVSATGGNPLALQAAADALDDAQVAGDAPLPDPPPIGPSLDQVFAPSVAALPKSSRRAVAVVAVAGANARPDVLASALDRLGLRLSDLDAAESARLIEITSHRVDFRHPLVRSAAYHAAAPAERRAAHRALASGAGRERLGDAYAWHLAAAAVGPDATAAAALTELASDQRTRGGHAAASRAFAQAAVLTQDGQERAALLLEAAREARLAGHDSEALRLADGALSLTRSPIVRAGLQSLRAEVEVARGRLMAAHDLLLVEAERLVIFDRRRAAALLVDATLPLLWSGEVDQVVVAGRQAYAIAQAAGGSTRAEWPIVVAMVVLARIDEAGPGLERWVAHARETEPDADPSATLALARILTWQEDHEAARELLRRYLTTARAGAPASVPLALEVLADLEWRAGHWSPGLSAAEEGVELAAHMGQDLPLIRCLAVRARYDAVMGRGAECRAAMATIGKVAAELAAEPWVDDLIESVAGLLALGRGDGPAAADHLGRALSRPGRRAVRHPGALLHLGDLVEAELMAGRPEAAHRALAALERRAEESGRVGARAIALRCRGMLDADDRWEDHLAAALALHERMPAPFEQARTLLTLAERLRRARRRADARAPLRSALGVFETLGAEPWASRARAELRATGERVSGRRGPPSGELTAQELRVALAVAEGATNREAAAALFLSPKTVEHHLTSVYGKLGVRSRTALARRLLTAAGDDDAGAPPIRIPSGSQ